jgi:ABC-2 type transport system ATP-binding protein
MRLTVGLDAPTAGTVTVGGRPYRALRRPLFEVGAMLEGATVHPGPSARAYLPALAQANAIPRRRVDEVLGLVGLHGVAGRRAGGFSLGMTQRLGVAAALLGDPAVLLLDEPVNGLDPEGVAWIRTLLRSLAAEGRTVFVSSHLMSEMALTADHLIVIGRGRLIADTSVDEFVRASSIGWVQVRSPHHTRLAALLRDHESPPSDVRTPPSAAGSKTGPPPGSPNRSTRSRWPPTTGSSACNWPTSRPMDVSPKRRAAATRPDRPQWTDAKAA